MDLETLEHRLLNNYQRDFPLEPRPFARIADDLGVSEDEILATITRLGDEGTIGRVGAVIRPNTIGASILAAMAVPADRLEDVAAIISARPEVNHNYEREHALNLWFVVTGPDPLSIERVLAEIERDTGLETVHLPLVEAYNVDLGFDLQ